MYGAYLRKSRADLSMERNNHIDTLKRHKDIILNLAKERNIKIDRWYQEIVSAETIDNRPEVKEMLKDIDKGMFDGIFVIDIDRLARGDTADQARIFKSFAYSCTKIITPNKIYDPNNEADEEFFEFGLFMSRREYKLINKRLNRGRISSVNEGKFVASICPYGYTKEKIKGEKGYKLVPLKEEAEIIKLIFLKACEGMGSQCIANLLNTMNIKPRKSRDWSYSTIRDILSNSTYYGMVKWNYRKTEKKLVDGIVYKSRPKHKDYILVKGLHEALISKEVFDKANINRGKISPKQRKGLQNPLAGLVKCYYCNRTMQRKSYKSGYPDLLICTRPHCQNHGIKLQIIEEKIVEALIDYFHNYTPIIDDYTYEDTDATVNIEKRLTSELDNLKSQLEKTYDLLEQGIYDKKVFMEREKLLKEKIEGLTLERSKYKKREKKKHKNYVPNVESVLKDYYKLSIGDRNKLLKAFVQKINLS